MAEALEGAGAVRGRSGRSVVGSRRVGRGGGGECHEALRSAAQRRRSRSGVLRGAVAALPGTFVGELLAEEVGELLHGRLRSAGGDGWAAAEAGNERAAASGRCPSSFSRISASTSPCEPAGVAEAHLDLGRVDVHVHVLRRHGDQQDGGGVPARLGQAAVGFAHGVLR